MAANDENWKDLRKPVEERAKRWLSTTGFPTESKAASALRAAGFTVVQGMYVPGDQEAGTLEVDAIAQDGTDLGLLEIVVECKFADRATGKAWVGLGSEEVPPNLVAAECLGSTRASQKLGRPSPRSDDDAWSRRYRFTTAPVYSLRVMTTERSDDVGYLAPLGVIARAQTRIEQHEKWGHAIVVPVIVVEGDLIVAKWNSTELEFTTEKVDCMRLVFNGHPRWQQISAIVEVVQLEALPDFAKELLSIGREWLSELATRKPER